jgi:hypothetical protein
MEKPIGWLTLTVFWFIVLLNNWLDPVGFQDDNTSKLRGKAITIITQ